MHFLFEAMKFTEMDFVWLPVCIPSIGSSTSGGKVNCVFGNVCFEFS